MRRIPVFFAAVLVSFSVFAAGLDAISNRDAVSGLKQALTDGSAAAVRLLGRENGFFGNAKVKIPLPPALEQIEGALRMMGKKKQADELVLAMNRAAEAAVPQAKALLVDAVKKMSVQDAKGILTGGDTAATDYFRRTTEGQLTQRFLPVVKKATDRVRRPRATIQLTRRTRGLVRLDRQGRSQGRKLCHQKSARRALPDDRRAGKAVPPESHGCGERHRSESVWRAALNR